MLIKLVNIGLIFIGIGGIISLLQGEVFEAILPLTIIGMEILGRKLENKG